MATVSFILGGMSFEYDENKNRANIKKHGIDFRIAARVFFDYDRIEAYDDAHSQDEARYNTIGDTSAAKLFPEVAVIGVPCFPDDFEELLFVVYTDRVQRTVDGQKKDIIRLISARLATEFERGLYYGKF